MTFRTPFRTPLSWFVNVMTFRTPCISTGLVLTLIQILLKLLTNLRCTFYFQLLLYWVRQNSHTIGING